MEVGHERAHRRRHGLPRLHRGRAHQEVQRVEVRRDDVVHLAGRRGVRGVARMGHHLLPPRRRRGRAGVLRRAPRRGLRHPGTENVPQRGAPQGSAEDQDPRGQAGRHRVQHRFRIDRREGRAVRPRRRPCGRRAQRLRQPHFGFSDQEAVALSQRRRQAGFRRHRNRRRRRGGVRRTHRRHAVHRGGGRQLPQHRHAVAGLPRHVHGRAHHALARSARL